MEQTNKKTSKTMKNKSNALNPFQCVLQVQINFEIVFYFYHLVMSRFGLFKVYMIDGLRESFRHKFKKLNRKGLKRCPFHPINHAQSFISATTFTVQYSALRLYEIFIQKQLKL